MFNKRGVLLLVVYGMCKVLFEIEIIALSERIFKESLVLARVRTSAV